MRNVSDESCREHQNTFYVEYFVFENRAAYEITWKNIVPAGHMVIWCMRVAC